MTASLPFILLIIYFFVIALYWLGAFFIIYHLIRFGVGIQPKKYALVFLIGSIILFFISSLGLLAVQPSLARIQDFKPNLNFDLKLQVTPPKNR